MIRSNLCDYSDVYINVKATIIAPNTETQGAAVNNGNKKLVFKSCAPFTNCVCVIKNTQVDYVQDIDIVMPMHNLIEHSNVYSKISRQCYRDEPALDNNNSNNFLIIIIIIIIIRIMIIIIIIKNFSRIVPYISFKFKQQITGQTGNYGTRDVEIMVPLKNLSSFWRTIEIPLINCELSLQLKLPKHFF